MELFLMKLLPVFFYPLSLALELILLAIFLLYLQKKRAAIIALCASIFILWVFSLPMVSTYLRVKLERVYLPIPWNESPSADAIVILGGAVGARYYPRIYPDLSSASDRVLHAVKLYKAKKAPFIIASGGRLPWIGNIPETEPTLTLLEDWGVPRKAVILEGGSANSRQNAFNTKQIMEKNGMKRILLVTSALHMRRALATFYSLGIDAIPSPTDYEIVSLEGGRTTILDLLPDAGSLASTNCAIREYMGYIAYQWLGWI